MISRPREDLFSPGYSSRQGESVREITSPKKKHHAKVKRENMGVAGDDFTPVRFL